MVHWLQKKTVVALLLAALCACIGTISFGQTCMAGVERAKEQPAASISAASLRVPEKAWKHLHKAFEAERAQRAGDFNQEIAKALEIAPNFADAYVLRASSEVATGHFEAAIADVLAARRADPYAPWTGIVLAGSYNSLHRYSEAAEAMASLTAFEASTWQGKYEMARAVIGLGDTAAALHWSMLALEAAPVTCIDARLIRANAFLLARRWNDAVEQLTLYADSNRPQLHRDQVLKTLERARFFAQRDEQSKLASVEPAP